MSIQPEEYVSLNQPDFENPSTVSFLQDKFEFLKRRIQNVGIGVCGTTLLIYDIVQLLMGIILAKECDEDKYTPAYFIIAGIIGSATVVAGLAIQVKKYNAKITQLIYPFYVFKIVWLLFGTYYFIIAKKKNSGCITAAYTLSYWLIVSHYICFQICMLVFVWSLSILFVLVYFKNAVVRHLAKSVTFEN